MKENGFHTFKIAKADNHKRYQRFRVKPLFTSMKGLATVVKKWYFRGVVRKRNVNSLLLTISYQVKGKCYLWLMEANRL